MAERTTKTDLILVPTKDLINELAGRHDAMVFSGIRFKSSQGDYILNNHFHGHNYVVLGLLSNLTSKVNNKQNEFLEDSQ